jgi:hypothetical protein
MDKEKLRRQIIADDIDEIKQYAQAIESHCAAAVDGDKNSVAWVKAQLKPWAEGKTSYPPHPDFLKVAVLHFLGDEAVVPLKRAEEYDRPKELDAANIAYQAVCNGYGDQSAPFADRIKQFLRDNWPAGTFTEEAIKRIGIVANQDTKTGPKRNRSV